MGVVKVSTFCGKFQNCFMRVVQQFLAVVSADIVHVFELTLYIRTRDT